MTERMLLAEATEKWVLLLLLPSCASSEPWLGAVVALGGIRDAPGVPFKGGLGAREWVDLGGLGTFAVPLVAVAGFLTT